MWLSILYSSIKVKLLLEMDSLWWAKNCVQPLPGHGHRPPLYDSSPLAQVSWAFTVNMYNNKELETTHSRIILWIQSHRSISPTAEWYHQGSHSVNSAYGETTQWLTCNQERMTTHGKVICSEIWWGNKVYRWEDMNSRQECPIHYISPIACFATRLTHFFHPCVLDIISSLSPVQISCSIWPGMQYHTLSCNLHIGHG